MINVDNLYEDLKVLLVASGYFTEDDSCGYDEIIFAVRKSYLLQWLNDIADHEVSEDEMQRWLEEEYTSDNSYDLYLDAKMKDEIVFESPVWNTNRMIYYRVSEYLKCDGEYEEKVFIRTLDYDTAKKIYEEEKNKVMSDEDFFLKDCKPNIECWAEGGFMRISYEREDEPDEYLLELTQVEVEREGR